MWPNAQWGYRGGWEGWKVLVRPDDSVVGVKWFSLTLEFIENL